MASPIVLAVNCQLVSGGDHNHEFIMFDASSAIHDESGCMIFLVITLERPARRVGELSPDAQRRIRWAHLSHHAQPA